MAIKTADMPVVAGVGVAVAMYAMATGAPSDAAEILGAATRTRGAEDLTMPDIAQLQDELTATLGAVDRPRRTRAAEPWIATGRRPGWIRPGSIRPGRPIGPVGPAAQPAQSA